MRSFFNTKKISLKPLDSLSKISILRLKTKNQQQTKHSKSGLYQSFNRSAKVDMKTTVKSFEGKSLLDLEWRINSFLNNTKNIKVISVSISYADTNPYGTNRHFALMIYEESE